MAKDSLEQAIGFGRPPQYAQFRKGTSGNPKGRPRKIEPPEDLAESKLEAILRRTLNKKFRVSDGSGTKLVPGIEVLLQAQFQSALKGNPHAQRNLLAAVAELERRDVERQRADAKERRESFARIVQWKKTRQQIWDAADKISVEPEQPWPHPDDILIDAETQTYRIRGPMTASDEPLYEYFCVMRDFLLCEVSLALRRRKGGPDLDSAEMHDLLATAYDKALPLRWQLGESRARIQLGVEMHTMRELKRAMDQLEQDATYWHRLAYPSGQKIRISPEFRKWLKPIIGRIGHRSIAEYERYLATLSVTGRPLGQH
ncbi:MAG: DUF5681 domain-containing protein [Novosphingobium sp.]